MSLAPTLQLERSISVGVGLVAVGGLIANLGLANLAPAQSPLTIAGLAPTVATVIGPVVNPDVGTLALAGNIAGLARIKVITTGLPDGTANNNSLIPTLIWQETALPNKAPLSIAGQIPAIIGDGGQTAFISRGEVIFSGLAPTISIPAGQTGVSEPTRGQLEVLGLVPFIAGTLVMAVGAPGGSPDDGSERTTLYTITGHVPTFSSRTGWTDVPEATTPTWADVPDPV